MPTKKDEEYARPATPPDSSSLSTVRAAAKNCTACHLYKHARQTVFGEGPKKAPIVLIGEQPGDYEDVAGKPFVGPAGKIMNRALEEAGIDRGEAFLRVPVNIYRVEGATPGQELAGELDYEGTIDHAVQQPGAEYARAFSESPGLIEDRGVYLAASSHWVPQIGDALMTYTLAVELPAGWKSVSQGERTVSAT